MIPHRVRLIGILMGSLAYLSPFSVKINGT